MPLLAPEPLATAPLPVVFALRPQAPVQHVKAAIDWSQYVWFAYIAMAALLLVRLAFHWLRASRVLSGAIRVEDPRVAVGFEVRESAAVAVPATAGLLRPIILLPATWREWDEDTLRAALVHEAAHASRRDPLLLVLAAVNASLFWFHPLARWAEARLRRLCEEAADDVCLEELGDRGRYASVLVEMAEASLRRGVRLPWPAIAMARPSEVKQRIDRMLADGYRAGARVRRGGWLVVIAVSAALLVPLATVRVAHAETSTRKLRRERAMPYDKWLNEDVVYIISAEERAAFQKLAGDEEREQFIDQFWLRRDPTPTTRENEFKREHYRRIAHANERFESSKPGWRTDRGHMYIVFGPPDEIESHPTPPRREVWHYRTIEGLGTNVELTFTDPASDGEYRLEANAVRLEGADGAKRFLDVMHGSLMAGVAGPADAISLNMETSDLASEQLEHYRRYRFTVRLQVFAANGQVVHTGDFEHQLPVRDSVRSERLHQLVPQFPPGTYRVHFTITDQVSHRVFERDVTHTVPPSSRREKIRWPGTIGR